MGLKNHHKRHQSSVSKEDFCHFCHLLYAGHLVTGVGGNLSVRISDKILITPSGYSLRDMEPDMVVTVDKEGRVIEGGVPTKDVEVHLGILRQRDEINVVGHVHGAFIIAASAILESGPDALPPITPGFVYLAHPLAMIPFMVPGTEDLSDATTEMFLDIGSNALLLQNHGLITVGKDFREALNIAEEIDEAARIYLLTDGRAKIISGENISKIKELRATP